MSLRVGGVCVFDFCECVLCYYMVLILVSGWFVGLVVCWWFVIGGYCD